MIPAVPAADLVFVEADVRLAGLELGLNRPAGGSHAGQSRQRRRLRRVGEVVSRLGCVEVAPMHQPHRFSRLAVPTVTHALGGKAVDAWSLGAFANLDFVPRGGRQGRRSLVGLTAL